MFSPDEDHLLVSSKGQGLIFILDAFDGNLLKAFSHTDSDTNSGTDGTAVVSAFGRHACFTPDGAYVMAGTDGGKICFWAMESNVEEGKMPQMPSVVLEAGHSSQVECVACSPTHGVIASSCSVVALWTDTETPQVESDEVLGETE